MKQDQDQENQSILFLLLISPNHSLLFQKCACVTDVENWTFQITKSYLFVK